MATTNRLKEIVSAQKAGKSLGIYSCCSANEFVLRAALKRGKETNSCVLIESTANQCDQYGGYTGMKPADFKDFVYRLADEIGFNKEKLFLGGDHLGPLTFAKKVEAEAMIEAKELVRQYVLAGFTKIHIDTSMKVADDDPTVRLSDETIARRGVELAKVAEDAFQELLSVQGDAVEPVYIVGSEVPIPGGATGAVDNGVQVTKVEDFKNTYQTFENAFENAGLSDAWQRVIGIVVQPGVEEKDSGCTEYDRALAAKLCASVKPYKNIIFEGHSTDYQTKYKLREMVEDGIGILKVGPALTFAMREALFALENIEKEALHGKDCKLSHFSDALESAMLKDNKHWASHYEGDELELRLKRKYSFSDRCRYYMPVAEVEEAKNTLISNLCDSGIALNLLSQFMPIQYTKVREGMLENTPEALIEDRIINTIDEYLFATRQEDLF